MEDLTGDILIAFGEANGMEILGHRDPNKWADMINRNGGICPCGKECPCDDCTCKFYGQRKEQAAIIEEVTTFTNKELETTVGILEDVKKQLLDIVPDNAKESARITTNAAKLITEDAEKHNCGLCEGYLNGLGRQLTFLGKECSEDEASCGIARDEAVGRIEMLQEIFTGADGILANGMERGPDETPIEVAPIDDQSEQDTGPNDIPLAGPEKATSQGDDSDGLNDFNTCVAKTYAEVTEVDKGPKLCVAAKMCKKDSPLSKEDAIAACKGRVSGVNKNGN